MSRKKDQVQNCYEGESAGCCELCHRNRLLTKHHLIPRAVHTKKRFIRRHGKQEMRERGLMVCKECHDGIHDIIPDERELAENYTTKADLLANPKIRKHVAWVRKQK